MRQPSGKCPCFCSTPTAEGPAARGSSPTAGLACSRTCTGGSACRSGRTAPSPPARGCVREGKEQETISAPTDGRSGFNSEILSSFSNGIKNVTAFHYLLVLTATVATRKLGTLNTERRRF